MNVYWGSGHTPQKLETFKNNMGRLLNDIQIFDHPALGILLMDMFLTAPTYTAGFDALATSLTLLARYMTSTIANEIESLKAKRTATTFFNTSTSDSEKKSSPIT